MTAADLRHLWAAVDTLAERLAEDRKRIEQLERAAGHPEVRRIPVTQAARRLGLAPVTVRRLIEGGTLDGLALRLPDRSRRSWVVSLESLERFEAEHVPTGALGAPKGPISRQAAKAEGG